MPGFVLVLALLVAPPAARGFSTDRAAAERAIAFRPFVPARAPLEVELLPPFHDAPAGAAGPVSADEGIAYTYGRRGRGWILSEWRRGAGDLNRFAAYPALAQPACADVHAVGGTTKPRGVAWTTPRGLVLSLVPDGSAEPRIIAAEWRRLVRAGACR